MINLIFIIVSFVVCVFVMLHEIHIMQLQNYNLDQELIWYKKNINRYYLNFILLILSFFDTNKFSVIFYLSILNVIGLFIEYFPTKKKKKLIFTNRIKRLIFLCLTFFVLLFFYSMSKNTEDNMNPYLFVLAISPIIVFVAFIIIRPVEKLLSLKFINQAKKIIRDNDNLYKIGITGSFGKTSVKNYLKIIFSERYNTCATKESFNTTLGVTKTIRENLKNIDDIFICEMGARRVHDIKEICDIVEPTSCIITDVGEQHLDTFKNINNVIKTKFEIVDSVKKSIEKSGNKKHIILLNGDNENILHNILKYKDIKDYIYTFGFNEDNNFYPKDIVVDENECRFTIVCNGSGINKEINIKTHLIGNLNIKNLVAAVSFAILFGIDDSDIINAVRKIKQVEHRLEVKKISDDYILIDDAYNSNIIGAKNAVDTLFTYGSKYKKVIITPGIVELGDKQYEENYKFSKYASMKVDYIFVVGKTNRSALLSGASEGKIKKENIFYFDKFNEAIQYVNDNIIEGKKVVLIENDLPDNY